MNITHNQKAKLKKIIKNLRNYPPFLRRLILNSGLFSIGAIFPLELLLLREAIDAKSYLDLGCGRHSFSSILPEDIYSIGIDIFEPYLKESSTYKRHTGYIRADLRQLEIREKSFDVVMFLDVLEHFTKEEGEDLINKAERIARRKVIIFTPNGFLDQHEYDDNIFQLHKSGWTVADFKRRGYRTYGARGLKCIGKIKWFSVFTQSIVYFFPKISYQLFCVKYL